MRYENIPVCNTIASNIWAFGAGAREVGNLAFYIP
jgi:hypothetical protein